MEVVIDTFLYTVATADVLAESDYDVNLVETQVRVHFAQLESSSSFLEEKKQNRPRFLVLANFITCLPPEIPRVNAFIS